MFVLKKEVKISQHISLSSSAALELPKHVNIECKLLFKSKEGKAKKELFEQTCQM